MISREQISSVVKLLQESRRPIFIWGAGIRPYADSSIGLARSLGIPVACTWGALDLINHNDSLMCGGFGTHGTRAANFAVQNADFLIVLGSRLDTKATGQASHFARAATLVMVDIDRAEIEKFSKLGRKIDIGICADAGEFIEGLKEHYNILPDWPESWYAWEKRIQSWRKRYDTPTVTWTGINPYEMVKEIGKYTTAEDIICSDTGTALGYMMQAFPFKGERFLHAFNMTPMGYGLPAALGAWFATGRRIVLVTGDGSFLMSACEMATVARQGSRIKIILLNNGGHAMCRQTERQWFGGRHVSTDVESGLGFPDFFETARAFGIRSYRCKAQDRWDIHTLKTLIPETLSGNNPRFLEVFINPDAYLIPQARFGAPIEDQEPLLDREEFKQQMIVDPV